VRNFDGTVLIVKINDQEVAPKFIYGKDPVGGHIILRGKKKHLHLHYNPPDNTCQVIADGKMSNVLHFFISKKTP